MPTGAPSRRLARRKADTLAKIVFSSFSIHPRTSTLFIHWVCLDRYACSTAVQHAKSLTGLTIRLNVTRPWVREPGSRPWFSKTELLHLLDIASEKRLGRQSTSGVTSLRLTSLNWDRMKRRDMLEIFASCLQVRVDACLVSWLVQI